MVTIKQDVFATDIATVAIAAFEGIEMAQAHITEKTDEEVMDHFEANYITLPHDAPISIVLDTFLDELEPNELIEHMKFYGVTDAIEALVEAGRLKALSNMWVFRKNL